MMERFKGPYGGLSALSIVLIVVVGGALIALWPLVFIWAVNTLFEFGIPFTFWTWLAAVVILLTIAAIGMFGRGSSAAK